MKHALKYYYCLGYGVILFSFALYWGEHFTEFVHFKGDDFIVCVLFALLLTYLLLALLQFTVGRLSLLLAVMLPISIAVLSVPIGVVILLLSGMDGTPAQLSLLYSAIHGALTIFSVLAFWKRGKLQHSTEV